MSTHVPVFLSFFSIFATFCIGQISHQQHEGSQVDPLEKKKEKYHGYLSVKAQIPHQLFHTEDK